MACPLQPVEERLVLEHWTIYLSVPYGGSYGVLHGPAAVSDEFVGKGAIF